MVTGKRMMLTGKGKCQCKEVWKAKPNTVMGGLKGGRRRKS